jgi:hypothetical protein
LLYWGGLTPTRFLGKHDASSLLNVDVFIYIMALLGLYGSCLAPWYFRLYWQQRQHYRITYMVGLVVLACLFLLIHPLSNEYDGLVHGGALFLIMAQLPTLFSSSILSWLLFPAGILLLYITIVELVTRRDFVMASAFPLWIAANLLSDKIYQRYYEPFLLFAIGYSLVVLQGNRRWYDWASFALLLLGLTAMTLVAYVLPLLG